MTTQVIDKTDAIFVRDGVKILDDIKPELAVLLASEAPRKFTVKMDGSCGAILRLPDDSVVLCRRQDIKTKSANFPLVRNNVRKATIADQPCLESIMNRSGKKKEIFEVPIYIFMLDEFGSPKPEADHLIGFTPLDPRIPDDAFCLTAMENGKVWVTSSVTDGVVSVVSKTLEEILGDSKMQTVELMGTKICQRYTFSRPVCCINPHGSIEFSTPPPVESRDSLRAWFQTENDNFEANVEGIVIHFPETNERFKVHRGHVDMEKTWKDKKSSGFSFVWV